MRLYECACEVHSLLNYLAILSPSVMFLPKPPLAILLFLFIRSVTPLQQLGGHGIGISLTSNTSQSSLPLNGTTVTASDTVLNAPNIQCGGAKYGYNPNILDCEDAKEYVAPDTKQWTFGERHTGLPDGSKFDGPEQETHPSSSPGNGFRTPAV